MRCLNCHTVMMDTDPICPSCRTPVDRATAAPPALTGSNKSNGLWLLFPVFGGALGGVLGGVIRAGVMAAEESTRPRQATHSPAARAAFGADSSSGFGTVKLVVGLVLFLAGGIFLVIGGVQGWGTWTVTRREPKLATAADLCKKDYADKAASWIVYTFEESKSTGVTVTRRRLANGGDVQARCLLVRVGDRWLVATVAQGFEGNSLVGRLVPGETGSAKSLIERMRSSESGSPGLLPFEFNAVDGSASDQQIRYGAAAILAFVGVLGLGLGLFLFRSAFRSAMPPAPVSTDW